MSLTTLPSVTAPLAEMPEPDLAVVRGEIEDYDQRDVMASDVALVVEIAQATLATDQTDMKRVYGARSIPVYWIVNLIERQIEVSTDPTPEGYRTSQTFKPGEHVPVVIGGAEVGRIAVSDILR
jgi:Uma2 family endonuclease